ncbi:hypothetical protein [Zavarzinella formosa]|uniref:hypothetical protein n=1 Tax=Zavarzinella formosa TaxID=360055 RepID=UPI0012F928A2|nr:hypothetical protein [Zavarzinella formosa]
MKFVRPLFLSVLILAGCGNTEEKVKTYPVTGQINYDSKPAAGVQVFLVPTSAPMVPEIPMNPHALTGPDGRFTVQTYGEKDGAAEGGYQVVLLWPAEPKSEDEESQEDRLLGWYTAVYSTLTVQIKPTENNIPAYNLPVKKVKPAAMKGIPGKN